MAGCLCTGEQNILKADIEKWTEQLSNVLNSPRGLKKFRHYLESREIEQGQRLLDFLEKCENFPRSTTDICKEAQSIVEFADSDINFNRAEMEALHKAVESKDKDKIMKAISEAKQKAEKMLENEEYQDFVKCLVKEL